MAAAPDHLVTFVRTCLAHGIPRPDISRELVQAGWKRIARTTAIYQRSPDGSAARSRLPRLPLPGKRLPGSAAIPPGSGVFPVSARSLSECGRLGALA